VSEERRPEPTFVGNTYDLLALIAAVVSGMFLFSCMTGNYGYCCLPPLALILGAVGLISARSSRDPGRTRVLSLIGIGGGGLIIVLIAAAISLYICAIGFVIAMNSIN